MTATKLNFPKFLVNVPCAAEIELSAEDGGKISYAGKCVFSDRSVKIVGRDDANAMARGRLYIDQGFDGFMFSGGGCAAIYPGGAQEQKFKVIRVDRPRNPDGSVNHTVLYLL